MKIKQRRKKRLSKWLLVVPIAIVLLGGYGMYAEANSLWPFATSHIASTTEDSKATSTKNPASSRAVDKKNDIISPQTESHIKNGGGSGQDNSSTSGTGISDTGGSGVTKQSGGVSSKSGNITLYSPASNQTITGEIAVKGAANVSEVFYRINDNVHGMISNGRLEVHNGYFSGNLSASTNATEGTFEVYSLNSQGQEVNNISVKVNY